MCFLSLTVAGQGQGMDIEDKNDSAFFQLIRFKFLHLTDKDGNKSNIPFSGVNIIDARFDTLSVGFNHPGALVPYEELSFDQPLSAVIQNYITRSYNLLPVTDSTSKLLIVLDKYWITSSIVKDTSIAGSFQEGILIKANILAERNGGYYPLYTVDTMYTKLQLNADNETALLENGIDKMLTRIINKSQSELKISRRKLAYDDITAYVNDRFAIPILGTTLYKKGIYKTFQEFTNNNPSITNYEIVYKGRTDVLRGEEEGGPMHIIKNAWGFCDGTNLYICSSDNFFLLCQEGKSFEINGFKSFTYVTNLNVLMLMAPIRLIYIPIYFGGHLKDKKVPLQIDMETGELF